MRLFDPNAAKSDTPADTGSFARCTPEILLEFIREARRVQGRMPTDAECYARFGQLNTMVCAWELLKRGLLKDRT